MAKDVSAAVKQLVKTVPASLQSTSLDVLLSTLRSTPSSVGTADRELLLPYAVSVVVEDEVLPEVRDQAREIASRLVLSVFPPTFRGAIQEVDKVKAQLPNLIASFRPDANEAAKRALGPAISGMMLLVEQSKDVLDRQLHMWPFEEWLMRQMAEEADANLGTPNTPATNSKKIVQEHNVLSIAYCWLKAMYCGNTADPKLKKSIFNYCSRLLALEVVSESGSYDRTPTRTPKSPLTTKNPGQQISDHTAILAIKLLRLLCKMDPKFNKQVFDVVGDCFRSTLPSGGVHTALQVDALQCLMLCGAHDRRTVEEDLMDFFKVSVRESWSDQLAMLQLFTAIRSCAHEFLSHYPTLLPSFSPLLLKAVAWTPALLEPLFLDILPLLLCSSMVPSLLSRVLDLPCLVMALETSVPEAVKASSAYAGIKISTPGSDVKKMLGSYMSPLTSYFTSPTPPSASPFRATPRNTSPLEPAADVITNWMDRDFTGGVTDDSAQDAEESSVVQLFLQDLAGCNECGPPTTTNWESGLMVSGMSRAGSEYKGRPRMQYVAEQLGPAAVQLLLQLLLHDASDALMHVVLQELLLRRCRVWPLEPFAAAVTRLLSSFIITAISRIPNRLHIHKKYILPFITSQPTTPNEAEVMMDLIWLLGEFIGTCHQTSHQDEEVAFEAPILEALSLSTTSKRACSAATSQQLPYLCSTVSSPDESVMWGGSHSATETAAEITQVIECMEVMVYERLGRMAAAAAEEEADAASLSAGSPMNFKSGSFSSRSRAAPPVAAADAVTPAVPSDPTPEEKLIIVSLTALTKLITRRKDMRPRVRLMMEKLVSNDSRSGPVAERAAACLRVMAQCSTMLTLTWQGGHLHTPPLPTAALLAM